MKLNNERTIEIKEITQVRSNQDVAHLQQLGLEIQ
jgi:hypothetical protein